MARSIRVPIVASMLLGTAIASPFWWAIAVRTATAGGTAGAPDASIEAVVALWPAVLVLAGVAWGLLVVRYIRGDWSSWWRGATAGGLGNGVFALAVVLGPVHDLVASSLPPSIPERFVILLPALAAMVAGGTGVLLALALGMPRQAVAALLVAAAGAWLRAFAVVGAGYVLGLRVGSGAPQWRT